MYLTPGEPFLLGVNYWPRRKGMAWWSDFDATEVRDEFDVIKSLGLTLVRIFLLWDDWQPEPDQVNPQALNHLESVADIAAERGLRLDVTFFTGHMSGPSWTPRWMLRKGTPHPPGVHQVVSRGRVEACGYLNPYADEEALQAQAFLLRHVVTRLRAHPAIALWNLGNEPDLFARPSDAAQGLAWARRMTGEIHACDTSHPVTCGLHVASLASDNGLRVHDIFAAVDSAVMHGYAMLGNWTDTPLAPDLVPFFCALTAALSGKPVLLEEFGGCTAAPGRPSSVLHWTRYGLPTSQFMASEEAFADYLAAVFPRLVDVGATGALLWCFADYHPSLYDRPPCDQGLHERSFGLVRPDGSLKPHAEVVRRFAASRPRIRRASRTVVLGVTPEVYYRAPLEHARRLYGAFCGEGGDAKAEQEGPAGRGEKGY